MLHQKLRKVNKAAKIFRRRSEGAAEFPPHPPSAAPSLPTAIFSAAFSKY